MRLETRSLADAQGAILMHNIVDADGRRILKKGLLLTAEHLALLAGSGCTTVAVGMLEESDAHEDEAALALAEALQTEQLDLSRPAGGRVNLRATVDGVLEVDARRLIELNLLPGITLGTRRQFAVVGPNQLTDNIGTLKIIPFAVRRADLDRALQLARAEPGIIEVRPFQPGRRAALLLVGDPSVHDKLRQSFETPTRTRLQRLGAQLAFVEGVAQTEAAIAEAASRLESQVDLLIIGGQTSIMDENDSTVQALRQAGAELALHGAPVEPGNLLALAYFSQTPVLCAPGCAKGLKRNVVDLVLPRLLLGDHLERRHIAELALGGFLTAAERGGDTT
jgi:molybdenum cofactor cytidylyltransferase